MKSSLVYLLITLFTGASALAQTAAAPAAGQQQATRQQPTPEERADAITASMSKNLRLNPAQTEKVKKINLSSIQLVENLRQQHKGNPARLDQELKTVSSSRLSQLKDVLSPAQFAAYQQRREEKMGIPKESAGPNLEN